MARAVEVDEELRHARLLLVARGRRFRGPSRSSCSARAARPRSTARSGPKILTARFVLLPEIMWSMRWLIGCPKRDRDAGDGRHRPAHLGEQLLLAAVPGRKHDLHLGGVDALDVLVLLGAAGAAAGRDDLGNASSASSTSRPSASLSASGDAGRADDADRERSFVERRQEAAAEERQRIASGGDQDRGRDASTRPRCRSEAIRGCGRSAPCSCRSSHGSSRRSSLRARQEQIAEHRRDGERRPAATPRAPRRRRTRAGAAAGPRCRAGRTAAGTPAR